LVEHVLVAIMLDVVARPDHAIRQGGQDLAQLPFGAGDLRVHDRLDGRPAITVHQLDQAADGDIVRRDHRLEIEAEHVRQARHAHDHLPEVLAQDAAFDEPDARQQHRLLLDLRGADRPGAEAHAADIELVRAGACPGDMAPVVEDGGDDRHIRLMDRAAIGVVEDEHVPLADAGIVREVLVDRADDRGHRAGVEQHLRPHGDDRAIGEIEAVVEVRSLGDHRRAGDRLQRDRLFLGDRLQLVAHHLEGDRVDALFSRGHVDLPPALRW
jgi:hypothetical protein